MQRSVTSSTIDTVFSVESAQSAYKRSECRKKSSSGQLRVNHNVEEGDGTENATSIFTETNRVMLFREIISV
jgi:hypothetical protein